MTKTWKVGTVVWAKYATYPWWPSRIASWGDLDKDVRKALPGSPPPNHELVWFFGTHNYGYVAKTNVTDYDDGFDEKSTNKKEKGKKNFVNALKEATKWMKKGALSDNSDSSSGESSASEESEANNGDKKEDKPKRGRKKKKDKEKDKTKKKKDGKKSDEESDKKKQDSDKEDKTPKKRKITETGKESVTKKPKVESPDTPPEKGSELDNNAVDDGYKEGDLYVVPASSKEKVKLSQSSIASGVHTLQRHPVAKYLKYTIGEYGNGSASATATFSNLRHNTYEVHSSIGTAYYLLDVTCLVAALTIVNENETAITLDFHTNVLAPIPPGSEISIKAKVVPSRIAGILSCSGEIYIGGKLMVTCNCTKSTLEHHLPGVKKHSDKSPTKENDKEE